MPPTPRLGLETVDEDEILGYVSVDEALAALDVLVQASVLSRSLTTPPGAPADGDAYIPQAPATGAWTGHEDDVAEWFAGTWIFLTPRKGWLVACEAEDSFLWFNGAAWVDFPGGGGGGGGATTYKANFSASSITILGATHAFGTADMDVLIYTNATPRQRLPVVEYTVHPTTFDVVITFTESMAVRVILVKY